jgi:hypothetical protein
MLKSGIILPVAPVKAMKPERIRLISSITLPNSFFRPSKSELIDERLDGGNLTRIRALEPD